MLKLSIPTVANLYKPLIDHPRVVRVVALSGGYSREEATTTAALIRGGALPVELVEVQSSVQAASIGADALDKSIVAGAIGIVSLKKTRDAVYLYFAHNTDSFVSVMPLQRSS